MDRNNPVPEDYTNLGPSKIISTGVAMLSPTGRLFFVSDHESENYITVVPQEMKPSDLIKQQE